MTTRGEDPSLIHSTATSLEILEFIAERGWVGVSEVASALDVPVSTVYEHVHTLECQGYLVKEDGQYRASLRLLGMGTQIQQQSELFNEAKVPLDSLADETGLITSIMVEEHGYGVYLYKVRGRTPLRPIPSQGTPMYLHTLAMGKVILASLPDHKLEGIIDTHGLPAMTDSTITDRDRMAEELETVRSRGYAIDRSESVEGLFGIAVPIRSRTDGEVLAGIGLYDSSGRNDEGTLDEELLEPLERTKNTIEVNLKYS